MTLFTIYSTISLVGFGQIQTSVIMRFRKVKSESGSLEAQPWG